jgi:hypothetical protein
VQFQLRLPCDLRLSYFGENKSHLAVTWHAFLSPNVRHPVHTTQVHVIYVPNLPYTPPAEDDFMNPEAKPRHRPKKPPKPALR